MRFLELYLKAYGPFTDSVLDVSRGTQGLHVIYGPNEAGKSSALRAVHALLFGIHGQTPDNFVHDYADLRIGARLADSNDGERVLWRRKGNKDTLLDENEEPVDDARLTRLLGGITEDIFREAFGIDHAQLVRGGKTLLAGGGEVGESLFAAGLGSANLRDLLHALDRECEALFKGGPASKPTINRLVRDHKDLVKATKDISLSGSAWTEARRAESRAERKRIRLDAELQESRKTFSRLERVARALPRLARRAACRATLGTLEAADPVPTLREGFADERREAERSRERSAEKTTRAEGEITTREEKLAALAVPEDLLAREEEIEALRLAQDRHVKASEDTVRLEGRRQQHASSAADRLRELRPGTDPKTIGPPKLSVAERAQVEALIDTHGALASTVTQATKTEAKRARTHARLLDEQKAAAKPPDPSGLIAAVDKARRFGDLAARLAEQEDAEAEATRQTDLARQRLGLLEGSLDEAEALAVPDASTIERFESAWDETTKASSEVAGKQEEVRRELEGQARELAALESGRTVPTEEDLSQARAHRDEGWQLVRRAWLDDETVDKGAYDADRDLPQAYEYAVSSADGVADDLRLDSNRVAEKAQLLVRQEAAEARLRTLEAEQERGTARQDQTKAAWHALWEPLGIAPLEPKEMRAWLERHARLLERIEALRHAKEARSKTSQAVDAQRAAVLTLLQPLDDTADEQTLPTLDAVLDHAEAVADRLEQDAVAFKDRESRLEAVEEELEEARSEHEGAEADLDAWRKDWKEALEPLALDVDTTPEQARAVLQLLADLRTDLKEEEAYAKRIRAIQRDARAFADDVRSIVEAVAPDLATEDPHVALRTLAQRAGDAVKADRDRERLEEELEEWHGEKDREARGEAEAARLLAALCAEAGADAADALPGIEERARQVAALRAEIESLEDELVREGKGASLADLEAEAEGVDGDELDADLETRTQAIHELEEERNAVGVQLGGATQALAAIEGTAEAARRAAEAESVASEIRTHAEHYVRLRLARAVLQREIERYRTANQAPLLQRARAIFAAITCGSFTSLESGYADGDHPVLLGIRPSGQRLRVEAMSDGTREQLYLALRLASFEQHLVAGTAVPLVVDDLLLRSDEARSKAILEALADLSASTQVLFFTHQRRYVELAEGLDRPAEVFTAQLQ